MPSFVCDYCQETLKKAKLDLHKSRCRNAQYSCVDCSQTFKGTDYRMHTSCISEAEKYQKSLYKGNKQQQKKIKLDDVQKEEIKDDKKVIIEKKDENKEKKEPEKEQKDEKLSKNDSQRDHIKSILKKHSNGIKLKSLKSKLKKLGQKMDTVIVRLEGDQILIE